MRPGLVDVLDAIAATGARLGAVSDYPADRKLAGARHRRPLRRGAVGPGSARVGVFKPDPKGLLVALGQLGVEPGEALYVGDRAEVDGRAAAAAGMRCVLVGR